MDTMDSWGTATTNTSRGLHGAIPSELGAASANWREEAQGAPTVSGLAIGLLTVSGLAIGLLLARHQPNSEFRAMQAEPTTLTS